MTAYSINFSFNHDLALYEVIRKGYSGNHIVIIIVQHLFQREILLNGMDKKRLHFIDELVLSLFIGLYYNGNKFCVVIPISCIIFEGGVAIQSLRNCSNIKKQEKITWTSAKIITARSSFS